MSPTSTNASPSKFRETLRGLGELAAFLYAGVSALAQVCLGRLPEFPVRQNRKSRVGERISDRITPFPGHD